MPSDPQGPLGATVGRRGNVQRMQRRIVRGRLVIERALDRGPQAHDPAEMHHAAANDLAFDDLAHQFDHAGDIAASDAGLGLGHGIDQILQADDITHPHLGHVLARSGAVADKFLQIIIDRHSIFLSFTVRTPRPLLKRVWTVTPIPSDTMDSRGMDRMIPVMPPVSSVRGNRLESQDHPGSIAHRTLVQLSIGPGFNCPSDPGSIVHRTQVQLPVGPGPIVRPTGSEQPSDRGPMPRPTQVRWTHEPLFTC